jgi:endo-1,4-beta-xylanase
MWYLIFQNRDANYQPAYCTNPDISNPKGWSNHKILIAKDAEKKWIDFWIIADYEKVFLFYTEGHKEVMVRTTRIQDFPGNWSKSKIAFNDVHEAVHIYKVRYKQEFHLIYEMNKGGIRSFGLARATNPEGPWEKITEEYATGEQLNSEEEKWTEMVSHGEAIRSGYNQLMEYEPEHCRWIIQGIQKKELNKPYQMLPWQLGIIEK